MTKEEAIQKLEVSGSYYREMIEFHDDKDVALVAVKKEEFLFVIVLID